VGDKAIRNVRHLVVTLTGSLDQFSEVVAIFFYGDISDLRPGGRENQSVAEESVEAGSEKQWIELLLLSK
jgi:hypothetical protein